VTTGNYCNIEYTCDSGMHINPKKKKKKKKEVCSGSTKGKRKEEIYIV
jgi:hypothetical protein